MEMSMSEFEAPNKKEEKLNLSPVYELKEPMQNILEQMRDRIDNKEYKLIIGDDASGRVPTFIFRKFLKKVYGKEDAKKLQTLFFAGFGAGGEKLQRANIGENGLALKKKLMADFLTKNAVEVKNGEKVLLVTDSISTGSSIKPMVNVLHQLGYAVDVISIGLLPYSGRSDSIEKVKKAMSTRLGCDIFWGSNQLPAIYNERSKSGVEKHPGSLHAKSVAQDEYVAARKYSIASAEKLKKMFTETAAEARRAANGVADELAEWYGEKEKT